MDPLPVITILAPARYISIHRNHQSIGGKSWCYPVHRHRRRPASGIFHSQGTHGLGFRNDSNYHYCLADHIFLTAISRGNDLEYRSSIQPDHIQCLFKPIYSSDNDICCADICPYRIALPGMDLLGISETHYNRTGNAHLLTL